MIEYNLEAELKKCIKSMHSGYIPKKDADHIRGVMEKALEWITDPTAPESPEWMRKVNNLYWNASQNPRIRNPLAWALYQVWKEYDSNE